MKLTPDPFDAETYPDRGVLYVRQPDTGVLIRLNVAFGISLYDGDSRDIMFSGTAIGKPKVIKLAQSSD
ncbi:hypothetical protein GobsT_18350 [Gemmata obscuriglobus]|uniref:Uncharacterized protein n=1 Tax=Gemmata obscuriglobus TaxID=114 RepID=A0A2Z3GZ65_9BACT|nr:hypothetical protein [Gemmata obscuriglobus]AWM39799.1 hypothetical protein C1280_24195 [Gemmata obscuriglobus]QEG27082.1 hypothetical protein GobsT_18350 [Gemmata obscuriglobus]VTS03541.1 unnamed protein product [Gemmata obscuriglobus UQM 2246]